MRLFHGKNWLRREQNKAGLSRHTRRQSGFRFNAPASGRRATTRFCRNSSNSFQQKTRSSKSSSINSSPSSSFIALSAEAGKARHLHSQNGVNRRGFPPPEKHGKRAFQGRGAPAARGL